jgi:hypothetical protein
MLMLLLFGFMIACSFIQPRESSLSFELDWEREGIELTEEGWGLINDKGYQVLVTEGVLVNHTLQLLPCRSALPSLGFLSTALAAHDFPAKSNDSSAFFGAYLEQLKEPSTAQVHLQKLKHRNYCSAHILVAKYRVARESSLNGLSLQLQGRWRRKEGAWSEFKISTGLANGKSFVINLPEEGDVVVIWRRKAATWFDGIDFAVHSPKMMARQLLNNLMQDLTVEVKR